MKNRAIVPIVASCAVAAVAATAIVLFVPHWVQNMVRVVAGYDAAATAILIWYWSVVLRTNAVDTRARAASQDPGRDAVFVVVLLEAAFGFVAAFDILGRGPHDRIPQHESITYALGFSAVALGWSFRISCTNRRNGALSALPSKRTSVGIGDRTILY